MGPLLIWGTQIRSSAAVLPGACLLLFKRLDRVHARGRPADLTFQHIQKAVHCDLIPPVVHLCSSIIKVQLLVHVVEDAAGVRVARVAGHVVSQHQNDLAVGDAQPAWKSQRCWQFSMQLVKIGQYKMIWLPGVSSLHKTT